SVVLEASMAKVISPRASKDMARRRSRTLTVDDILTCVAMAHDISFVGYWSTTMVHAWPPSGSHEALHRTLAVPRLTLLDRRHRIRLTSGCPVADASATIQTGTSLTNLGAQGKSLGRERCTW